MSLSTLKTMLLVAISLFLLSCYSFNHKENKASLSPESINGQFEGHINFIHNVFEDVDSLGFPIKRFQGNDSAFLSTSRTIYIYNYQLIDVNQNTNFDSGNYTKTDTLGYSFYDLQEQKYLTFKSLSKNADVIKKGEVLDEGSFSNANIYDPMYGIMDSLLIKIDTIINGKSATLIRFISPDSLNDPFAKRAKFWIDPKLKNFPLQLSYILSSKMGNGFVYKMQLPMPDGKSVSVSSFEYQARKLPDSLISIFKSWAGYLSRKS